ncbi:o-succinylbenzoate--CoA ligase [Bacillus piscicola]|uniref:o-succinylbenzoate--CoA ligase n=1 Tax=Bacillus piscicola TaxID=1632684 RepID=UPI001F088D1D|nr:o-succinylbenzoate--CoA ligase [Bacillus piscicola]
MLPNWLKKRASLTPERQALEFQGSQWTFQQLDEEVTDMAARLAASGIKEGEYCALLLRNHADSVIIIHALFYIGARIVMLNHKLTTKELDWQFQDSGASWIISEEQFGEKLQEFPKESVRKKEDLAQISKKESLLLKEEFCQDETATIMYTSGTTGRPKGVIQTFGNHWWSAVGSVLNLGLQEKDRWYCAVPIFHISGLSILMRSVIYGMKVVLAETFVEQEVNRSIREDGVTIVSVVSAMLNRMLADVGDGGYPDHFRCMLLGGGPAPKPLLEECKEKHIPVFQTYGMTETSSQIVTLSPEDSLRKLGSAGKPLFSAQIKIVKEGKEAPAGTAGEIVMKGPNVTKGYLHRPEATAQAIKNGWLYSGDIGFIDEEGFLYVLDRRSDLIISGGENVYPAEVEAVLRAHPQVFEAAVVGRKDKQWGEVPAAFIVAKDKGTTATELEAFCKKQLAAYKVPRTYLFCKELPRNGAGKVVRRDLKEQLGEE